MSLLVQKKESSQVFDFDIAVRPGEHVSWGGALLVQTKGNSRIFA